LRKAILFMGHPVLASFARGCHAGGITQFALLSAVGSTAKSRIRYVRVMGLKEETVQGIGFKSLAIFRPGIIAGNAHTPSYAAWLGRLIPGPFGTIEQDDIGRAFVAEFMSSSAPNGVVYLENGAMRQRSRALDPGRPNGCLGHEIANFWGQPSTTRRPRLESCWHGTPGSFLLKAGCVCRVLPRRGRVRVLRPRQTDRGGAW
jgi:hypothetical protein